MVDVNHFRYSIWQHYVFKFVSFYLSSVHQSVYLLSVYLPTCLPIYLPLSTSLLFY